MVVPHDNYPDARDLSRILWPVENIGKTFASTASAVAGPLEVHWHRVNGVAVNLSTLFIHYNARLVLGKQAQDTGVSVNDVMAGIRQYGACTEATWPMDPAKVTVAPPPAAYEEAKKYAAAIALTATDPIEALSMEYPLAICPRIPERCVVAAGQTGVLPDLTADERNSLSSAPGYAFTMTGYDKTLRTFTLRNAWGTQWGKGGHCTVSFDTMAILCPNANSRWFITKPQTTAGEVAHMNAAAPAAPAPPAAPAQPESMADMAARLRAEIRGDLSRDLTDASKRIRDMMNRNGGTGQG